MKGTLEFDLNEPDERNAHKRAVAATDVYIALHDFDNYLRAILKYEEGLSDAMYDKVEGIRKRFHEVLEENSVNMDDLE